MNLYLVTLADARGEQTIEFHSSRVLNDREFAEQLRGAIVDAAESLQVGDSAPFHKVLPQVMKELARRDFHHHDPKVAASAWVPYDGTVGDAYSVCLNHERQARS